MDSLSIYPSRGKENMFHQFVLSIYIKRGPALRNHKQRFDLKVLVKLVKEEILVQTLIKYYCPQKYTFCSSAEHKTLFLSLTNKTRRGRPR